MIQKKNIRLLLSLAGILLLADCQNSPEGPQMEGGRDVALELMPVSTPFLDVQWAGTRADEYPHLPDGYVPYDMLYPTPMPEHRTIGVFMTPERVSSIGKFIYQGNNVWNSTITVRDGRTYYVYGFMPREDADNATITPLPGQTSYEAGAVLKILGYRSMTTADVCVIVGARWATEEEKIAGNPSGPVKLGAFKYIGHEEGKNRIFVLLKHVYAGIHFKVQNDPSYPEYFKLRSIKVKRVELVAHNIPGSVDLTVNLTANNDGIDPTLDPANPTQSNIQYVLGEPKSMTETLYNNPEGYEVSDTEPSSFLGCYVPGKYSFSLRTIYDVYDKNQKKDETGNPVFDENGKPVYNLLRENCEAVNKFKDTDIPNLSAGELFTVNMFLRPTYLYQMSEPDLENPIELVTTP